MQLIKCPYINNKNVPLLTVQALKGKEVKLLLILDPGTRGGEWSTSRPALALPPGKDPPVPIG
jgi:hypothetical protein